VSNLLYCHDIDPRFDSAEMRAKIAQLYLPLVDVTCQALGQLWDPDVSGRAGANGDGIDLSIARAISQSSVPAARGIEQGLKVSLVMASTTDIIVVHP